MITIDLSTMPVESVILCVDYFSAKHSFDIPVIYDNNKALIDINEEKYFLEFSQDLSDFIKRMIIADKTRTLKEIIIGRALYGILDKCSKSTD